MKIMTKTKTFYILIISFFTYKIFEIFHGAMTIGYNIDEPYHLIDGQNWISRFSYVTEYPTSYVYGPLMGGLSNLINTLIGNGSIGSYIHNALTFQITHLITAFVGLMGTLAFLFLRKTISGFHNIALITLIILLSIPIWTGNLFHNIKDIPLATGYTLISIGLILFALNFQNNKKKLVSQLIICLAILIIIGTRPAIMFSSALSFVFVILFLWKFKKIQLSQVLKSFLPIIVFLLVSTPLILPQFLSEPKVSLLRLLGVSSEFPWTGSTLTAGKLYPASFSMDYYLLWLFAQTPLLVLVFFSLGMFFFFRNIRSNKLTDNNFVLMMFFIQFMAVPFYALISQSAIYNGLRHILFIYPAIAFFAAFGFLSAWQVLKSSLQRKILLFTLIISIVGPNIESFILRPFQQSYFNPTISALFTVSTSWETEFLGTSFREANQKTPMDGLFISSNEWPWKKDAYVSERGLLANDTSSLNPGDYWQVTSVGSYIGSYSRERMLNTKSPLESVRAACSVENVVYRNLRFEKIPLAIVMRCQNSGKLIPGVASLSWATQTEVDKNNQPYIWVTNKGEEIRISNLRSTPLVGSFKINLFSNPCKLNFPVKVESLLGQFEEEITQIDEVYSVYIPLNLKVFETEVIKISTMGDSECRVGESDSRNFLVGINKFDVKLAKN
jgi:hypothetical protein